MTITIASLRAAGLSAEQIVRVFETVETEKIERRRTRNRINKQNQRSRHHVSADSGDIDDTLTSALNLSSPSLSSEKKEKEGSKIKSLPRKTLLPDGWEPKDGHLAKAERLNLDAGFVAEKADDLRNWAHSKAVMRADWDATFYGFLKPKEAKNGQHPTETLGQRCERLARKARQLEEAAELFPADDHIRGHRGD